MKTKIQILEQVNKVKPCGIVQLDRYIKKFGIIAIGNCRMRPQVYPEDSADKILAGLGLTTFRQCNGMDWANGQRSEAQCREQSDRAVAQALPAVRILSRKELNRASGRTGKAKK